MKEVLAEERRAGSRTHPKPGRTHSQRTAQPVRAPPRTASVDDVSSHGLALAAQRMASSLGRTALIRQAGSNGAHLIRAIADGRLPGSAASTRLRGILMEFGQPPGR